jgi:hypothetical protein
MTRRFVSTRVRLPAPAAALALALLAAGCGPSAGTISGKVTYNGETLGSGTVQFNGPNATAMSGIAADGTYTIPKMPVGTVQIAVETTPPPPGTPQDAGGKITGGSMSVQGAPPPPGKYVPIPDKYKDPRTSGLSYEVKSGKQQHDLALQ